MRTYKGITVHTIEDSYVRESLDIVDQYLRQVDSGFKRIQEGLSPSVNGGSLAPPVLEDYFYLPGRLGGQIGYGGTASTDELSLIANPVAADATRIWLRNINGIVFDRPLGGLGISYSFKLSAGGLDVTDITAYSAPTGTPSLLNLHSKYAPGTNGGSLATFTFGHANSNSGDQPLIIGTNYNGDLKMCGVAGSGYAVIVRRKPSLGSSTNPNVQISGTELEIANPIIRVTPKSAGTFTCGITSGNITITGSNMQNIPIGAPVFGTDIPLGCVVVLDGASAIVVTPAPTGTGSRSLVFGSPSNHLELTVPSSTTARYVIDPTFMHRYWDWSGSAYVGLRAPLSVSVAYSLTLPNVQGAANTVFLNDGSGNLSFASLATLGGAASTEPYITFGNTAGLSAERALAGTANQIVLTDGGAGVSLTLSTPQNLDTAANFQVGTLKLGAAPITFSGAGAAAHTLTWPTAQGAASTVLTNDGAGALTWSAPGGGTTHDMLSATHTDTLASAVSRGSLLYGNATPKWAELAVGTAGYVLTSDGTDVAWAAAAGGVAASEPFITFGNTAGLSAERALTGTANQVIITDNGAGTTVTLSTPQSLNTGATVQFGVVGIGAAAGAGIELDVTGDTMLRDTLTIDQQADRDGLVMHYRSGIMTSFLLRFIDDDATTPEVYLGADGGLGVGSLNVLSGAFFASLSPAALTANRVVTVPNLTGTIQLLSNAQTSSATMTWSGPHTFSSATQPLFKAGFKIEDAGAGTNTVSFVTPTAPTTHIRTVPGANAAGYLANDGAGIESWASADIIVAASTDARLSDARTPTAHATSHKSGGSDVVLLDELGAPTDVTTLDASLTAHGLLPKLPGGTSTFLRADGTFAAPTATAADPAYAYGTFTVATGTAKILSRHLILTTTQRATLAGTATLRMG